MQINELIRTSVGADYADYQNTPDICRGRFIAPTADLSALGGCYDVRIKKLISIIAPWVRLCGTPGGRNELRPYSRLVIIQSNTPYEFVTFHKRDREIRNNTMQNKHDPIEEGQQAYQEWRDSLLANPESRAIYEEEAAKKELWLQLVEARQIETGRIFPL